jgi:hypothetical protein
MIPLLAAGSLPGSLEGALHALVVVVLAIVFYAGVGCAIALFRVILPDVARAADRSLAGLRTGRMFVTGVLPLVGAVLVSWGIERGGLPKGIHLVVWVPILLLVLVGSLAAVPHVGGSLLRGGADASPLRRAVAGGLVTGLALSSWAIFPAAGLVVSLLLFGWILGIGLGAPRRRGGDTDSADVT